MMNAVKYGLAKIRNKTPAIFLHLLHISPFPTLQPLGPETYSIINKREREKKTFLFIWPSAHIYGLKSHNFVTLVMHLIKQYLTMILYIYT